MRKARGDIPQTEKMKEEIPSLVLPEAKREEMLGWLPVLGEWYRVNEGAKIFGFFEREVIEGFYEIGKETKTRRVKEDLAKGNIWMLQNEIFLITRLTVPTLMNDPAIVEIFSQTHQKNLCFGMFPPVSKTGAKVWEMMITHVDYEAGDK